MPEASEASISKFFSGLLGGTGGTAGSFVDFGGTGWWDWWNQLARCAARQYEQRERRSHRFHAPVPHGRVESRAVPPVPPVPPENAPGAKKMELRLIAMTPSARRRSRHQVSLGRGRRSGPTERRRRPATPSLCSATCHPLRRPSASLRFVGASLS